MNNSPRFTQISDTVRCGRKHPNTSTLEVTSPRSGKGKGWIGSSILEIRKKKKKEKYISDSERVMLVLYTIYTSYNINVNVMIHSRRLVRMQIGNTTENRLYRLSFLIGRMEFWCQSRSLLVEIRGGGVFLKNWNTLFILFLILNIFSWAAVRNLDVSNLFQRVNVYQTFSRKAQDIWRQQVYSKTKAQICLHPP